MITAIVKFRLPAPMTPDEAKEIFRTTAPIYRKMPGLLRKAYILGDDGEMAGGVYLWDSREAAEQAYGADWRRRMAQRYGAEPEVTLFETPVVVDNIAGSIIAD